MPPLTYAFTRGTPVVNSSATPTMPPVTYEFTRGTPFVNNASAPTIPFWGAAAGTGSDRPVR